MRGKCEGDTLEMVGNLVHPVHGCSLEASQILTHRVDLIAVSIALRKGSSVSGATGDSDIADACYYTQNPASCLVTLLSTTTITSVHQRGLNSPAFRPSDSQGEIMNIADLKKQHDDF